MNAPGRGGELPPAADVQYDGRVLLDWRPDPQAEASGAAPERSAGSARSALPGKQPTPRPVSFFPPGHEALEGQLADGPESLTAAARRRRHASLRR